MDIKEKLSFYEKLYYFELERKEKLIARLNLAMVIIIALFSLLSTMLQKAPDPESGRAGALFWTLYLCCLISSGMALWYFWNTWQLGVFDKHFPYASQIDEYHNQIEEYFSKHGENDDDTEVHFRNNIIYTYVTCTTSNSINNDKRNENFTSMARHVAITAILAIASFAVLSYYQWELKYEPTETAATPTTGAEICKRQ